MLNKIRSSFLKLAIVLTAAMPILTHGDDKYGDPGQSGITTPDELILIIQKVVGYLTTAFWIVVFAAGLWTAFKYLTAGGDPAKTKEAKQALIYLIIAIAIVIGLTAIKMIIKGLLT